MASAYEEREMKVEQAAEVWKVVMFDTQPSRPLGVKIKSSRYAIYIRVRHVRLC